MFQAVVLGERCECLTAPPEAATTQEKNMYHVKLAVKVLSVPPAGTAPPAMAPAQPHACELLATTSFAADCAHGWPARLPGSYR